MAGYRASEYAPTLTEALTSTVEDFFDNSPKISPEDANLLYPVSEPWTEPVSEYQAGRAYYRKKYHDRINQAIDRAANSAWGSLSGFVGSIAGGFIHDPIYMAGAMLTGGAFAASEVGASLSIGAYNSLEFIGSNVLRGALAAGVTEAAGSLAWDVPAMFATQQLYAHKQTLGIEMSAGEAFSTVLYGAMFAGMMGTIHGLKNHERLGMSPDTYAKYKQMQETLSHQGIEASIDIRNVTMDSIKKNLPEEAHSLLAKINEEGVYAITRDGRVLSSESMLKGMRNGTVKDIVKANYKVVTREEFMKVFNSIIEKESPEIKELLTQIIETDSVGNILARENLPVNFKSVMERTLKKVEELYPDSNVVDDYLVKDMEKEVIESDVKPTDLEAEDKPKGPVVSNTPEGEPVFRRDVVMREEYQTSFDTRYPITTKNMGKAAYENRMRYYAIKEAVRKAEKLWGITEQDTVLKMLQGSLKRTYEVEFPLPDEIKALSDNVSKLYSAYDEAEKLVFEQDDYTINNGKVEATLNTLDKYYNKKGKQRIKGSEYGKSMRRLRKMHEEVKLLEEQLKDVTPEIVCPR